MSHPKPSAVHLTDWAGCKTLPVTIKPADAASEPAVAASSAELGKPKKIPPPVAPRNKGILKPGLTSYASLSMLFIS